MQYSTLDLISDDLERIWLKPEHETFHKGIAPRTHGDLKTNGLLFIGLNPSEDKVSQAKGSKPEILDESHPYYARFPEIAHEVNLEWSHIDLLFFRQTKQEAVEALCGKHIPNSESFIKDQLELAKVLIDHAEPKVIVVNNSLARTLLGFDGGWLDLTFSFDSTIGTHSCNKVPVFFTSTLTGQRALDKGSLKRLKWHVQFALDSTK